MIAVSAEKLVKNITDTYTKLSFFSEKHYSIQNASTKNIT